MSREADMPGRPRRIDDEVIIDALSQEARRTALEDAGPGPTPAVWHRLQAHRARRSRPPWRGLLLASAGMAAAVTLLVVTRGVQRARPVTYVVEDAAEQDGYIRGTSSGASQVRFSDGTHVDLAQGARVSVLSRGPRGARLRVEEGEARFDVVHLPRAAWSVEAGPYVVYVTGTAFDVSWSGASEVIEVRMRSGSVQVGGPLLPERVTLRAGQRLTAKLASGEMLIGGHRVRIVGRVTMDMTMVDLTELAETPRAGDEVVLVGTQAGQTLTFHDLAAWGDTICYEVMCGISKRVPRTYFRRGKVETFKSLLGVLPNHAAV